jgi:replicative DNA helicase
MGKTAVACSMALTAAQKGLGVAYISLEMHAQELTDRFLSDEAERKYNVRLPYDEIKKGTLGEDQREAVHKARYSVSELPLEIEQQGGLTLAQILIRCRHISETMEKRGTPLSIVFIDHIGLVAAQQNRGSRYADTTEISNGVKNLAKELNVPIVVLSQLSRSIESRDDKRPMLSDLRDTGSLEQDADVVIFPYRESYYLGKKKDKKPEEAERHFETMNQIDVHVAKNRNGPEGHVTLYCDMASNVIRPSAVNRRY